MQNTRPVPAPTGSTGRVLSRLTAFAGVSLVATFLAPAFLYPFFLAASAITGTRLIAYGAMSCAAMLVGTALSARWFGDSWSDATQMGRAGAGSWTLFGGLAAGWFAITIPSGLLVWSGALKIIPAEAGDWGSAALQAVVMLAPAALTEELMFRGYGFTLVQRQWGARTAVVSTSMAFALMHLLNPGVSVQSVVMVGLAGIFLAVVRLSFASLWAAWLAHFAYNFVQLAVFHTAVSGIALPQPYYRAVSAGPAWLTGGDWGPEAGVAAAGGLLVVSFLLAVRARWIRVIRRGGRIVIEQRPQGREEP